MTNNRIPEERRLHDALGECKSLLAWSQDPRCIVSYDTLRQRLIRGWRMSRAMTMNAKEVRRYADLPKEDATPSRTYGNYAMPPGSLTLPQWNVRAGADQHLNYRSKA